MTDTATRTPRDADLKYATTKEGRRAVRRARIDERAAAKTKRAAVYARISKITDGDEGGVDRQVDLCMDRLQADGATLLDSTYVYRDPDYSGSDVRMRPEFERLLRDIEAGLIDVVYVFSIDRLTRSMETLVRIIKALVVNGECRTTIVQVVNGDLGDLSSPPALFALTILVAVSEWERRMISRRIREEKQEKVDEGRWHGGSDPYGYQSFEDVDPQTGEKFTNLRPIPEEAAVLLYLAEQIVAGRTLKSLEVELNDREVPPPSRTRATRWYYTTIHRMLRSPTNAGLRGDKYDRTDATIVGRATWDAVIPEPLWRKVALRLDRPKRRANARYLLSGLVYGADGTRARTSRYTVRGEQVPAYILTGANTLADELEEFVVEALLRVTDKVAVSVEVPVRDVEKMTELDNLRTELGRLAVRARAKEIDEVEVAALRPAILGDIRRLETELQVAETRATTSRVGRVLSKKGELRKLWHSEKGLTVEEQREFVFFMIERVVVHGADSPKAQEIGARRYFEIVWQRPQS